MKGKPLLEAGIKSLIMMSLEGKNGFVVEEWPNIGFRADLAHFGDLWTGYEVKSAADSLKRLRFQKQYYLWHFDLNVVVCASKHIAGVMETAPESFGVTAVCDNQLVVMRQPIPNAPNPLFWARALWKPELEQFFRSKGSLGLSRYSKGYFEQRLLKEFTPDQIRALVVETLSKRRLGVASRMKVLGV
jgi:hypothetical protein